MIPKLKIFIVEDDPSCAKLLKIFLTCLKYEVPGYASTGEKAILTTKEIKPDIIFMDIMLAGEINGIEAARQIKKNNPNVIIIFASAYDELETVSKAMEISPLAFIDKPYGLEDIQIVMQMVENVFATRFQNLSINDEDH